MAIIINMVYAKGIGLTQGSMAREVGSDMWISTILALLQGAVLIFIIVKIIQRMPRGDLIDQGSAMLGKWFGKVVSLLVFFFFLNAFGPILITFVYHIKDHFLPEGPTLLFVIVAVLIGAYAIHFGIEVIARMALVGVFSVLALNILILLGSLKYFDIREIMPLFSTDIWSVIWASRHNDTDWAMATMMAAIVLPIVKNKETWRKSSLAGIAFGGMFVLMWPILEAGVLSPEVVGNYIISCMQLARSAEMGVFIHRYEMIMVAFFALSSLTQIMVTLLCASVAAQKLVGLKDYRPMIIPVSLILGGYGYWVVLDHERAMQILEHSWVVIGLSIAVGLPVVLYLLGFMFKDKLKHMSKQAENEERNDEGSEGLRNR